MRLYKIVTFFDGLNKYDIPKDVSPDMDKIIEIVDLELEDLSIENIKNVISKKFQTLWERIPLHPSSSDIYCIKEYGRTIIFREGNYLHYIVDLDHPNYIEFKRNLKLEILLK